ncbi:hypothetical protein KFE25_000542 [Diacronema lutheri]|uniref:Fe2OG dioxygenase domain-containing protein n=1 Tax=Diacronema lutheri TaxID=2081491 RepID=A0A8J6CDM1_DIALT|nr:hypothetical protein KFE25_000542 [Diacronema lutheri]
MLGRAIARLVVALLAPALALQRSAFAPATVGAGDDACADMSDECGAWAVAGECEANPRHMKVSCAASCGSCDWASAERRCALDPRALPAVAPGDINRTFARIEALGEYAPRVLSREPWVVVLDAFLSAEEADALVAIANRDGGSHFVSSQSGGAGTPTGMVNPVVSEHRRSATQWCADGCWNESAVERVLSRAQALLRVPRGSCEPLQLLRYEQGDYYRLHSDYVPEQRALPCGPRAITLFLYLTENLEGGHTTFPRLGLSIAPKKGRAALWPSTLSDSPTVVDLRTVHAAEPVLGAAGSALKLSANLWVHTGDFMAARERACTGVQAPPPPSAR